MSGDSVIGSIPWSDEKKIGSDRGQATQKKASDLYFVECTTKLVESSDLPVLGTREVTLIHMSFTNTDLFIALPAGGVTLWGP
jgi:hypothetical protein